MVFDVTVHQVVGFLTAWQMQGVEASWETGGAWHG